MTNGNKRNCVPGKTALNLSALAAMILLVSACTVTSQDKTLASADTLVTGSVTKSAETEGVEGTDAEVIKTIVVDAENIKPKTSELAWSNPDTGNSGTILAIDRFIGSSGQKCKKFQTTVDSFMGISLYDGETCEVKRGLWVLSWFMRR
ncbi:MAG: hypothetical protein L3J32_00695 [Rhizobiaceae bacterium]|nr:hypothetical protein [Rhizobiaceae bacterium]